MKNIKLTIAYDGTNYCGWQIQANGITIQELVQKAVRSMTGEENNVVAAGRTDAGVHALAQAATFKTSKNIPPNGFQEGLNNQLPKDIRIQEALEVPLSFHPIRDAKSKHYCYLVSEERYEHPLVRNRSWPLGSRLGIPKMEEASKYLLGRHDFSAFEASGGDDDDPVKEIFSISIDDGWRGGIFEDDPQIARRRSAATGPVNCKFDVIGDGFLRHMVRNIVGTLVDVGLGKITPDNFKKILESKDRKKAGICAPAQGLYLVSVSY